MKSAARVRKAANVDGKGMAPRLARPRARPHHDLLGDVGLVETLRMLLLEPVAERRVLDVGVEGDDARGRTRPARRGPPRRPRRVATLAPSSQAGRRSPSAGAGAPDRAGGAGIGGFSVGAPSWPSSSCRARARSSPLNGLPCPAVAPLGERDALALQGARQDHRRPPRGARRLVQSVEEGAEVVPVHHQRVPAERPPPPLVGGQVVPPLRGPALPEGRLTSVIAHRLSSPIARRRLRRLPHRPPRPTRRPRAARRCDRPIRCAARSGQSPPRRRCPCPSEPVATSTNGSRGVG